MISPARGITNNGRRIDFSCTWYENMKNVIEIVVNPRIKLLRDGSSIIETIEGTLSTTELQKQKNSSIFLLNRVYQETNTSLMHQKLGTFN